MSPQRGPARVAVVGTGAIAQVAHLPILSGLEGAEIVAVHDSDAVRAQTIADRFRIPVVHRSLEALWSDDDVDAVVVCTPNHLHEEHVRLGLEAGKWVFCEKPLALTADACERLLQLETASSHLMVGMNQRFRPDSAALRSFVDSGELGDAYYLRAGWLNRRSDRRRTWRHRRREAGGGALMDLGIQMLDLSLWLLGYPEPERVSAQMHRPAGTEVEDSAVLLLHLEGGRTVNLEVTWSLLAERERQYLHVLGSEGSGSLSPFVVYKEMDSGLADVTPPLYRGQENPYTASYRQELTYFVEAVRGGRQLEAPREQVVLLRIVQAAYRSAAEGREVSL